jgi:hypothetical protein
MAFPLGDARPASAPLERPIGDWGTSRLSRVGHGNHLGVYALQGSLADFPLEQDLAEERQAEQKREDKR